MPATAPTYSSTHARTRPRATIDVSRYIQFTVTRNASRLVENSHQSEVLSARIYRDYDGS